MADTEDTETLAGILEAHGDVSYDTGTPREYTGHGGWNVDCGCGVFVGALADHDAHVARAVLESSWLVARDERIRADEREKLAAEVVAIADEWDAALRREFRLSDDDPKWTDWHSRQLRAALAGELEAR